MNKKQTIRLNESQLKRIVAEAVKRMLKEDFDIDAKNDIRYDKMENQGCIPHIMQLHKILYEMREKFLSLYDMAYQYYDTNNAFANSGDKEFQSYYWQLFSSLFENLMNQTENMAKECENVEDEIKNSLDKWDDEVYGYKSSFGRLSKDIYNNKQ